MKNIFKKELPWTGIALVVISISTLILSLRVAFLSVQIKQLKAINTGLAKSDQLTTNNFTAITQLQKTVYQRINDIETNSPQNCLKEHMHLYKEHLDALLLIKKLTERIENLERKTSKSSSIF